VDPVLGTLLGAIIGGAISYLAASQLSSRQADRDRRSLIVAKVEELYAATMETREAFRLAWAAVVGGLASGSLSDHLDRVPKLSTDRVSMLVNIYAPSLRESLKQLETAATEFRDRAGDVFAVIDVPRPQRDVAEPPLTRAFELLNAKFESLLEEVSRVGHDQLRS
jgi:hypothetical protein